METKLPGSPGWPNQYVAAGQNRGAWVAQMKRLQVLSTRDVKLQYTLSPSKPNPCNVRSGHPAPQRWTLCEND